ncbi:MAG: potassium-transporting ATPase subunit KdpC [Steroidobacteraceae bacterium]
MLSKTIRPALVLLTAMTIVTGFIYPLVITGVAQAAFPHQAAGSLLERDGKAVGSTLIGQSFTAPKYFWSRPSATGSYPYNAAASSGSNQGPINPALINAVRTRIATLHAADPDNSLPIPVDLVTASASGLDPHISRAAARYQLARVARQRGMDNAMVEKLMDRFTSDSVLGFMGEAHVNVLQLNVALDDLVTP